MGKLYKCKQCDRLFSFPKCLEIHYRAHSGEKPYKCDAEGCYKRFSQNSHLTRHKLLVHDGLKPAVCNLCGKGFGERSSLLKHMRVHVRQQQRRQQPSPMREEQAEAAAAKQEQPIEQVA